MLKRFRASWIVIAVAAAGALWWGIQHYSPSHEGAPLLSAPPPIPVSSGSPQKPRPPMPAPAAKLVSEVSRNLGNGGKADKKAEQEIREQAEKLGEVEIASLAQLALDANADGNERSAGIYLLTQAGPAANPYLARVAGAPMPLSKSKDPHSRDAMARTFEMSQRLRALESLDQRAAKDASVTQWIRKASEDNSDPMIHFFVKQSLDGIAQGRPGKLGRMFDKMLDEAAGKK